MDSAARAVRVCVLHGFPEWPSWDANDQSSRQIGRKAHPLDEVRSYIHLGASWGPALVCSTVLSTGRKGTALMSWAEDR